MPIPVTPPNNAKLSGSVKSAPERTRTSKRDVLSAAGMPNSRHRGKEAVSSLVGGLLSTSYVPACNARTRSRTLLGRSVIYLLALTCINPRATVCLLACTTERSPTQHKCRAVELSFNRCTPEAKPRLVSAARSRLLLVAQPSSLPALETE